MNKWIITMRSIKTKYEVKCLATDYTSMKEIKNMQESLEKEINEHVDIVSIKLVEGEQ